MTKAKIRPARAAEQGGRSWKAVPRGKAGGRGAGAEGGEAELLAYTVEIIRSIGRGNLDVAIDADRDRDRSGSGILAALGCMQADLSAVLADFRNASERIHRGSLEMNSSVKALGENVAQVERQTRTVAESTVAMNANMSSVSASSEELSVSMKAIAESARQSDENIEIITTGTRELSQASDEIARSTVRAAEISRKALENVVQATNLVSELEVAAREIGVVTSTISEISDQTKLLALNATIEAARAGEAGRGFAVVAKEVKDLASQTNTATRDIQRKVEVIQAATNRTILAINTINQVMKEVDGVVTTIAAATEEQSATTRNISANVVDTTDRIKEMSGSVKEGAAAVQEVNRSITGIAGLTDQVSGSIQAVSESNTAIKLEASVSYAHVLGVAGLGEEIRDSLSGLVLPQSLLAQGADTEPNLCRFTGRYKVSIEAMDADHGKIFEYINGIHRGIKNKLSLSDLAGSTQDLALFTREHFDREERMMVAGGYPELAAQQRAHHALLEKMDGYLRGLRDGTAVDLIDMMVFLKGWLQKHILGMDKQYGPYLNQKGVR